MKRNDSKSNLSLFFCISVAFLLVAIGCHSNRSSESSKTNEPEAHIITSIDDLDKMFSSNTPMEAISRLKDNVIKTAPYAPKKSKEELNRIIKYLDGIEKKPADYFNDINNIIVLMQTMVQINAIGAEMEPNSFKINYPLAYRYINTASFIESVDQSVDHKQLIDEYKRKGLQATENLIKNFPDEAKAYHQRAFFAIVVENDKEKALKMYKRCLSLDPNFELCKDSYDDLRKKLKSIHP
jgi:tetratricopeptide (TPR) repeat protein